MMTQQSASSVRTRHVHRQDCSHSKKAVGKKIAQKQRELDRMECQDNATKKHMQDRMKFMSAKNAMRKNVELKRIEERQETLRAEISSMQDR